MKKIEKMQLLNELSNKYLLNELDNGNNGKAYEIIVKLALNNYRFKGVSKSGKIDTIKNHIKYEIKSNCGELATIDQDGNIIKSALLKSDFIIYSMDTEFFITDTLEDKIDLVLNNSFVIPCNDFLEMLKNIGLLRTKKSTYAIKNNFNYNDKLTIQSYKNSKKKSNLFFNSLCDFPTLEEYLN